MVTHHMSRSIAILGLVQAFLIVGGFFGLGIVLKVSGYPKDYPMDSFGFQWITMAMLLRRYGLLLLLVPVIWTVFAALSLNRPKFILTANGWAVTGVLFSAITAGLFIYACAEPYTPVMILGR